MNLSHLRLADSEHLAPQYWDVCQSMTNTPVATDRHSKGDNVFAYKMHSQVYVVVKRLCSCGLKIELLALARLIITPGID